MTKRELELKDALFCMVMNFEKPWCSGDHKSREKAIADSRALIARIDCEEGEAQAAIDRADFAAKHPNFDPKAYWAERRAERIASARDEAPKPRRLTPER